MHPSRRRSWRARLRPAAPIALATLFLTACAGNAPQDTLDPDGPYARKVDNLIRPVFIVAGIVFILVYAIVAVCVIKFRRRSEDDVPKQVHGSTPLEIGWTIAPAVLLGTIGILSVGPVFDLARDPKGAYEIAVIGHQWWWEYQYPVKGDTLNARLGTVVVGEGDKAKTVANQLLVDGDVVVTAGELHIPAGRPVRLQITSADVIHSFWPPRLAGKIDAVPGHINELSVEADMDDVGKTFLGQCAEFCGTSHANMRLKVIVHSPADFRSWLDNQKSPAKKAAAGTDAALGEALFAGGAGCAACHFLDSSKPNDAAHTGPNLSHVGIRTSFAGAMFTFDEANLRAWLHDPQGRKPGNKMKLPVTLTEDQITQLVAYLRSLK